MGNQYIHVGSVTNAMRSKRLLEHNGIRSYVHRAVNPPEGDGCGYSVLVTGQAQQAVRILKNAGIRVIRISDAM